MGLLDKLKNVFFEEEEQEIEMPVQEKKERIAPVAKKIENVEYSRQLKEEPREERKIEARTREAYREEKKETFKPVDNEFKFPVAFDDKDFEIEEKKEVKPIVKEPPREEILYREKTISKEVTNYSKENEYKSDYQTKYESSYQGLYEKDKKEKKTGFTRSPIISPVYGILDKNYRKEEIVTKKEVRLSVTTNKKVDLDTVREKAYGDLASEITESMTEDVTEKKEKMPLEDNLLYDLSEDESPSVKVVTVGDAEEYYTDLGLEYNVDYKVEKEDKNKDDYGIDESSKRRTSKIDKKDDKDESNLFDLIDSMYEEKE